eukprot:1726190-Rhodomonas_salina.1
MNQHNTTQPLHSTTQHNTPQHNASAQARPAHHQVRESGRAASTSQKSAPPARAEHTHTSHT